MNLTTASLAGAAFAAILTACVSVPDPGETALRAQIEDHTFRSFGQHGTQVEYLAPDGRGYLWYPGNRRPVVSFWELRNNGRRTLLCFNYQVGSYNPLTEQRGGEWECQNAGWWANRHMAEKVRGDVFALSTLGLPFIMPPPEFRWLEPDDPTIADLLAGRRHDDDPGEPAGLGPS